MRWAGSDAADASDDTTWEPLDSLTNCAEAISAFERAAGRVLPRPAAAPGRRHRADAAAAAHSVAAGRFHSSLTPRLPTTWAPRSLAERFSTGGPTRSTGGSAAPWRASARA